MEYFNDFLIFLAEHQDDLEEQIMEHLLLTLVSLLFAIIAGVSTGILLSRIRKLSIPVLGFVNIIQTIPSIALLGFLLPLLGIGAIPAIVALFLYALLPIVRNTFTGIEKIDPAIRESAKGMGMTNLQILQKVELPLAVPVIFAGIRTAVVINVGVATLCALIAAGGLGEFIFRGIALNNVYMILAGAIPAAMLALVMDAFFGVLQKFIHYIIKPVLAGFGVMLLLVVPYFFYENLSHGFRAGFPSEFIEREDGYQGLKEHYDLNLETVEMEISLMYQALKNKKVDVISGFSTDGRIKAYNLRSLVDDKNYFPPYYAAPLISGEIYRQFPELQKVFENFEQLISDQEMIQMNYQVDQFKKSPYAVAKEFLSSKGFTTSTKRDGSGDIVIGSKNFTENFILAEMFGVMIENYTGLDADLKLGFGGTKLCFDALANGDIDLYPEYTGTGFLVILQPRESVRKAYIDDKQGLYDFVSKEFMKRYNILWLDPLGFNNTFAIMMRENHAERLNIKSISDLKTYLDPQNL